MKIYVGLLLVVLGCILSWAFSGYGETLLPADTRVHEPAISAIPPDLPVRDIVVTEDVSPPGIPYPTLTWPEVVQSPPANACVTVKMPYAYSPPPHVDPTESDTVVDIGREVRFVGRVEEGIGIPARVRMLRDNSVQTLEIRLAPGSWITDSPVTSSDVPEIR